MKDQNDRASPVTYREAGVDIDAGEELVERIKPHVKRSMRREVLGGIGGFGALVEVPLDRYRKPVLVSGTDESVPSCASRSIPGVTIRGDRFGGDVRQRRGRPRRRTAVFPRLLRNRQARCGRGRTPHRRHRRRVRASRLRTGGPANSRDAGMYHGEDYDLAGFCVGVVEKDAIIDGSATRAGDVVLGLPSSGPHSNGFSLIRKILQVAGVISKPLSTA